MAYGEFFRGLVRSYRVVLPILDSSSTPGTNRMIDDGDLRRDGSHWPDGNDCLPAVPPRLFWVHAQAKYPSGPAGASLIWPSVRPANQYAHTPPSD
ncbi:hypothetical protein PAAG_02089 [Paracoccidioides lutzii Pb01]|uniref:Uncharacterized protein n=1 Tax=Paracoccidioides lutzii (strain ATCC MYA-826 / Pb01) TaxID=502779 RepID=C1GU94_PARBA|nr:hypothetical protein PAAG_02089 [Paracoccidioides lutzii Pb01]EEH39900.2 hypothetical protein PAAG_02089 [Paracoccidioides lutzii Pb01]